MANNTKIEWTATRLDDGKVIPGATFNPWQGCTKVSEACRFCYAETLANRFGVGWGNGARRKFQTDAYWAEPLKWDRQAAKAGIQRKVFCASMADVFECLPGAHPDWDAMDEARARLWRMIEQTPNLIWLLLTKRPEQIWFKVPGKWVSGEWPSNCWIGTTVENQKAADERIPVLLKIPAPVRFLSMEPLLGPVDISNWLPLNECTCASEDCRCNFQYSADADASINWLITGGESGPHARPSHPDWFRSIQRQCQASNTPFFFKQAGNVLATEWKCVDKKGGDITEFPQELQVREFPQSVCAGSGGHSNA